MNVSYLIKLEPDDNGTLLVTCPEFPEVTTFGENQEDAVARAREAIEEAIRAHCRWAGHPETLCRWAPSGGDFDAGANQGRPRLGSQGCWNHSGRADATAWLEARIRGSSFPHRPRHTA